MNVCTGAVTGAPVSGGLAQALDVATNGRVQIWSEALEGWSQYPMGVFLQLEAVIGRSIHNEFITLLVQGGPVMLLAFVSLLLWVFMKARPPRAVSFGPVMAVAYAATAMGLGASGLAPFMGMAYYFIGWARGQDQVEVEPPS
jgi:hypothetical protein